MRAASSLPKSRLLAGSFLLAALCAAPAIAQPTPDAPPPSNANEGRLFGMEFEFAGRGNRIVNFEEMKWSNYEKLMREVVRQYGGNPADIKRVDFMKETTNLEKFPSGKRPLYRAEWVDPKGRKWMIEPEFVSDAVELDSMQLDQLRALGYELP